MGEVSRTVQWIDDPLVARCERCVNSSLFGESAVGREMRANMVYDALFGAAVGISHKVNRVFVFYLKSGPGIVQQQASRRFACVYGNREQACGRDSLVLTTHIPPSYARSPP